MDNLNLNAYFDNSKHLRVPFHVAIQLLGSLLGLTTQLEWDSLDNEVKSFEYKLPNR